MSLKELKKKAIEEAWSKQKLKSIRGQILKEMKNKNA